MNENNLYHEHSRTHVRKNIPVNHTCILYPNHPINVAQTETQNFLSTKQRHGLVAGLIETRVTDHTHRYYVRSKVFSLI